MQNNQQNNRRIPFASRTEMMLLITFGVLNLGVFALLVNFTSISPYYIAIALALVYFALILLMRSETSKRLSVATSEGLVELMQEQSMNLLKNTVFPVLVFDKIGTILWANSVALSLFTLEDSPIGKNISSLIDSEDYILTNDSERIVTLNGRRYRAEGFCLCETGEGLYALMLSDNTAFIELDDRYKAESVAIAYITIDNVEDILQYVHEKFQYAVSSIDDKVKQWAHDMGGIIKSYDNDKYLMIFDTYHLNQCINDRFAILDEFREVRISDGFSITLSIGVSNVGDTLEIREKNARDAIDLALQRGGDQVVVKTADAISYYGGRTKSVYKRTNVRSRTFVNQLMALMVRADNVIIMGHRYGDFDSFGASVGLARIAMLAGVKAHIAIDKRDKNLAPCIRMLQDVPLFSQVFVDNAEGLDLVHPGTLLVIADVNTPLRAQFTDIAAKVSNIVIVDHHRKGDKIADNVKLYYIEPSASSACELVTEMLQSALVSTNISKEEADILLSGILLDTKQFTRNTGTRTFAAAEYLRGVGANPTDVYELFKTDPSELSKEARFHTSIVMYRDEIAISTCEGETDDSFRIIASKAADKMLTLKNVEASFTLVRIGDEIHISGRSAGKVNVQLILEKLHGGGHFDVAGAQVISDSVEDVAEMLKSAIDEYLDER